MGIEVAHSISGVSTEEREIRERELAAIHVTEGRLRVMENLGGNVEWVMYPESDGRQVGMVYNASEQEIGLIALNREKTAARITSYEALKNESTARAAALFAATFSPPRALESIQWRMPGAAACLGNNARQTGLGLSVVGSLARPVVMFCYAEKVGNKVVTAVPPSQWLLYTEAEWLSFADGIKNDEFNPNEDKVLAEQAPEELLTDRQREHQATVSQVSVMEFGQLALSGGLLEYPIDRERVNRWARRSLSGQYHYSKHVDFILNDFFRQRRDGIFASEKRV
jgi:hypothetical protein